jgi:ribosomal protein L22
LIFFFFFFFFSYSAKIIEFGLHSARGNAVNQQGLALERLFVNRIEVNIGQKLARQKYHSKHRTGRMHRPHAHLSVSLAERPLRAPKSDPTDSAEQTTILQ